MSDQLSSPSFSRRIGNRDDVHVQGHVWIEVKQKRRAEGAWVPVGVDNASMTGLGLMAIFPEPVAVGTVIPFALNGFQATVRVVRVNEVPGKRGLQYGVEFVSSGTEILDALHRIVHGDETAARDDRWRYGNVD